jgi:DNA mismatch endonuclease (patch repair protein)
MGRDPKVVSYTMSRIRGKDTGIELTLRRALWQIGLRYRIHYKGLPGTPDVVFSKQRIAIFCDSSFWHGREWEAKKARLRGNRDYWIKKIERNIARDLRVTDQLRSMSWLVLRFWDIQIETDVSKCLGAITKAIKLKRHKSRKLRSPRRRTPSGRLRTRKVGSH